MKKKPRLIIIFCLCCSISILQAENYDKIIRDLHQQLEAHSTEDEKRVDLLNELSYAYRRSMPEKIDSLAQEALRLAEQLNYTRGIGIAYKNLGIATFKLGGQTDHVMAFYQKCYDFAERANDYYSQAACSNNMGLALRNSLRYTDAIKAFQTAKDIHEAHLPVDRLRVLIIGNTGTAYLTMDDYENAQLYLEEAINLAKSIDNPSVIAIYIKNYAFIQSKQGKVEEAIETLSDYLPKVESIGDKQSNIELTTILSSILIDEGRFDMADTYIKKGLQVAEQHNFPSEACEITINRSRVLFAQKRFDKALEFGEITYQSAKSRQDYQQQMRAAENLLSIYLATDNVAKAQSLFPVYNALMKRHFGTEQQKTYATLEIQYQNKKKEAENKLLKAQQIENESTIKVQRIIALCIFLLGVLATGGALFAYRTKRTQNDLLEQKVEERTKALNESNQNLERSNEDLEKFAYVASHDLKQPLNTIIGFADLLNKKHSDTLDTRSRDYLQHITKSGQGMKRFIEDILEYSRLNQPTKTPELIDLNVLVDELKNSISALLKRRNAQINVIGKLPSLKYEKTQMLSLFKNLIENGIKYNESQTPIISIKHSKNKDFTRISFTDNGIGIEKKDYSKLFKMFSRLENEGYEGTGIGLSMCKKITTNIGGNISIESTPGKGSTFHVDIPNDLFVFEQEIVLEE